MKTWRKNLKPDIVPGNYQEFRNILYSQAYSVNRLHPRGKLDINVKRINGESMAIVFYDWQLLRKLSNCAEIHVTTTTRLLPENMDDTSQLVVVMAVYENHVSLWLLLFSILCFFSFFSVVGSILNVDNGYTHYGMKSLTIQKNFELLRLLRMRNEE